MPSVRRLKKLEMNPSPILRRRCQFGLRTLFIGMVVITMIAAAVADAFGTIPQIIVSVGIGTVIALVALIVFVAIHFAVVATIVVPVAFGLVKIHYCACSLLKRLCEGRRSINKLLTPHAR